MRLSLEDVYAYLLQKASDSIITLGQLFIFLVLGGAGAIVLAFGADFMGIGSEAEFGPRQIMLAWVGFTILVSGVALDSTIGRRYVGQWFRELLLDMPGLGKFLSITVQLGLLVLVIRQFQLENQAFSHTLMLLIFYGFLIHYFLPFPFRLPFFLFLSLTGVIVIFGFPNSAWLIGIGLVLIGICHLPFSFAARIAILLGVTTALVALRVDWIPAPWSKAIWPILASMFMFRLIVYLYDLRHSKEPASFSRTLSYFFLLPNIVFPFFPVVDYNTFRRTYYNEDRYRIYQRGVEWILRGTAHLILYRFVNFYLVINPEEVTNISELVRYIISNFLLYLRVSGQFHLAVGILHLFGFNLPETHHLYCLASSFTDLWRRINIYWKDFMLKVFFYPTYFRLRQWETTTRLAVSMFVVFLVTWFLHAYQWFWLRGSFLLAAQDISFWAILTLLVVANTLYEAKRGRKRTLGKGSRTFGDIATLALRTAGTFTLLTILWSLWTSASVSDWISLISVVEPTLESLAALIVVFLTITVVFGLTIWMGTRIGRTTQKVGSPQLAHFRSVGVTGVSLLLLYFIGTLAASSRLGGEAQEVIQNLRVARLNDRDAALLERGYYENIIGVNQFNSQLWELYMKRPDAWPKFWETEAGRQTDDFLRTELVPSVEIIYHGATFSTNRWGMRDKNYEKQKSPNTYRIGLLGSSVSMGSGVADDETFEWLLEDRLNLEKRGEPYANYEILNFSVGGYASLQELAVFETKTLSFEPDAIFYIAHSDTEELRAIYYLWEYVQNRTDIPYDYLQELVSRAGLDDEMTWPEARRQLEPFGDEMASWVYHRIGAECRQRDILPIWVFLPSIGEKENPEEIAKLARLAEEAGFVVLDLSDVYEKQAVEAIRVAEWDMHPNALGHRLIADRLYKALQEKEAIIPLRSPTQTADQ